MLSFLSAIPQKTEFKTLAISLYQNDIFIQGNYIKFYSCFPYKLQITYLSGIHPSSFINARF